MSKYQLIKEKERMARKKIIMFLTSACLTFTLIAGANYIDSGNLVEEVSAYSSNEAVIQMPVEERAKQQVIDSAEKAVNDAIAKAEAEEKERLENMTIEEKISAACEQYGICDEIPLAIAKLETGHFTSNAYLNHNNPGGMSINEVPISYNTIEEGVDAFISNLAENYFGIGLTTPESIGQKYCPVNAEAWASLVRQLM